MIENFTIRAIYNKDHYRKDNWLKTNRRPSHFYVYEHGRWLCMISRQQDSTYLLRSYSKRVSTVKINQIKEFIERHLQPILPQNLTHTVFAE